MRSIPSVHLFSRRIPWAAFAGGVPPVAVFAAVLGVGFPLDRVSAATYECVDASGRRVFTDSPAQMEKCTPLSLEGKAGPSVSSPPSPPPMSPGNLASPDPFAVPSAPPPPQPSSPQDYAVPMPPELQPAQGPASDPNTAPPANRPVVPPAPDYETAMKNLAPAEPGAAPPPPPPQDGTGPAVLPLNPFNPLFPLYPPGSGGPAVK